MGQERLVVRLFWEEVKRKAWAAALLGLSLFFALPVAMAMVLPSYQPNEYVTMAEVIERRVKNVRMMLDFADGNYPVVTLILLAAAVVLGISTFSYLHDKKQVDLYHSLPVKRELLFGVRMGTGLLVPAALQMVFILLSLVVAGANGVAPVLVLPAAMRGFLLHLIYYLLVYSTVVLAMMMTGTRIAAILGTAVFFLYFPMLSGLVLSYYDGFFSTYYYGGPNLWSDVLSKISPLFALFRIMEDGVTAGGILWTLAFSLVLILISLLLYKERPLEAAGRTMAFGWSKGPVKVLLTIAFGLAGALFFYSIEEDLGWMVFGLLVGTAISHCVIEVIYHGDFKKLFRHKWTMAVCMAFGLVVCMAFYFDLFRYDTYIPAEGDLACASVSFGQDSWVGYDLVWDEDMYLSQEEGKILETAQVTETGPILALSEEGIRQLALRKAEGRKGDRARNVYYSSEDPSWSEGYEDHAWLVVCYTLKSGRKVYRRYSMWLDPVLEAADQVYTDPVYKKALFPGLALDVQEAAGNVVYREMGGSVQTLQGDMGKWQVVVEAYQEEAARLTMTDRTCESPVGELLLISDQNDQYLQKQWGQRMADRYGHGWYEGYFYPVYPSFTKTIKALADCGITAGASLAPERFSMISITAYRAEEEEDLVYKERAETMTSIHITYTDPDEIRQILAAYGSDNCTQKNGMIHRDGQYAVELYLKERDLTSSGILSGRFIKGKMPEFVRKDIEERWEEEDQKKKAVQDSF